MINSIATVKSSELWDTILSSRNYHSAARAPLPLSTDHQDTNEHVVVPTLRRISGMTVASNLEHIPPGVLGLTYHYHGSGGGHPPRHSHVPPGTSKSPSEAVFIKHDNNLAGKHFCVRAHPVRWGDIGLLVILEVTTLLMLPRCI